MSVTWECEIPVGEAKLKLEGKVYKVVILGTNAKGDVVIEENRDLPPEVNRMSYPNSYYGRRVIELPVESIQRVKGAKRG